MKTVIIAVLMACVGTVHANIKEWPEGSQTNYLPTLLHYHGALHLFDECRVVPWYGNDGQIHTEKGWVSHGELDAGTMFDSNLLALDPTTSANLTWDFGTSGFSLSYIIVNDGSDSCKIYGVRLHGDIDIYHGAMDVSAFNGATIQDIELWGRVPGEGLPDTGSTCLLFGVGIVALFIGRFDRTVKQAVKEGN